MKNLGQLIFMAGIMAAIICGCANQPESGNSGTNGSSSGSNISSAGSLTAGTKKSISAAGIQFNMVYVPGKTFKAGTADNKTFTIDKGYWMAETETTYELWSAVYNWATDAARGAKKYTFPLTGQIGSANTGTNRQPVTEINWRMAMVWCNALTEWVNAQTGSSYECVYYTDGDYTKPIRSCDSGALDIYYGHEDNPIIKWNAGGFRLPGSMEWELAARYIADKNNDGDICDSGEYYPGSFLSGADTNEGYVANYDYDGDGDIEGASQMAVKGSPTAAVKSKSRNALGLYDMCGNVDEYCNDWSSTYTFGRVVRGGSYNDNYIIMEVGWENAVNNNYNSQSEWTGFRISMNQ